MMNPDVLSFFDAVTNTVSYVVGDPATGRAAIVDPVLDFDPVAGRTSTRSIDAVVACIRERGWTVDWILETHVHADHLSGAAVLKEQLGGAIAISGKVAEVQAMFRGIFNLEDLAVDGRQFDRLFADGDRFRIGELEARVLGTPGHTPACVTYVIGDAAFVGDTLFMPDYGTARTDFPGGSAGALYDSIHRIFALPADTRLFVCHDYKAPGREEFAWETSVGAQRSSNVHVRDGVSREGFVAKREARDRELGMPRLIVSSIQVNVRAGQMPPSESNGVSYLKLPVDLL
jgi:glyoxylase-like metal-dependent hydrolase (beta-lactamase superfamily II)